MVMACIVYLDLCFKPTEVHNVETSYDQWLPDWLNHLISGSHSGTIPVEVHHTQTPLNKGVWQHHLRDYPYQDLVQFSWKTFQIVFGWDIMAVPCNQLGRI